MVKAAFSSILKAGRGFFPVGSGGSAGDGDLRPFVELTEFERQRLCDRVSQAGEVIARCWPLRAFIYRNPLQGFEHLTFDEAIRQGQELVRGQGYLSNETYRAFYHAGRISDEVMARALKRVGPLSKSERVVQLATRRIEANEILRLHLIYGIEGIDEPTFWWKAVQEGDMWSSVLRVLDLPDPLKSDGEIDDPVFRAPLSREGRLGQIERDLARIGRNRTVGEWVQDLTSTNLVDHINDQMIRWCSAFLDEGMTAWSMPLRDQGFYAAWRDLARYDHSGWFLGILDFSRKVQHLSELPENTIVGCLNRLGIRQELWTDYLKRHLAQLPGWAGFIKWRAGEPSYPWQKKSPINLVEYLAVRLFYEVELVEAACRKTHGIGGTLAEIQAYFRRHPERYPLREGQPGKSEGGCAWKVYQNAWRLFHLAQILGLSPDDMRNLVPQEIGKLFAILDSFPLERHGPVWLEAFELSYRQRLLQKLSSKKPPEWENGQERPQAQAVFCIDARSEGLRRHLEGLGNYETFGFAGFFGVPICYRPYDSDEELLLCPALIKPKHVVVEATRPGHEKEAERYDNGSRWHHLGHGLFHDLKGNNFTAYPLIDLFGGLVGLGFIGKTLFPRAYQRLRGKIRTRLHPHIPTHPMIDHPSVIDEDSALSSLGFTLTEQAAFVENGLRMMGLTRHFAHVVLLCAHGSTTENNPYAAAYDCGACGGNHGGPNARVLAAMANKPAVRGILREHGVDIPDDTLFIAGEHNTTTDHVMLLDVEEIPPSHQADIARLTEHLRQAGMRLAEERVSRLPGAPKTPSPEQASRHVEGRSADWSQVRPEWGLSSNAAFIIGRRAFTYGVHLEGRVFMHSYDPEQDANGTALETIMTAPLLVVQWISMEYYFSSTDPWGYGSGSKVIHNVVGGIGVMLGRQSDLRPGLPVQSVMNGSRHYHEPMRPLVIIEAPKPRVLEIIGRHAVLQQLFDNRWVNLIVLDLASGVFQEYHPGGQWEELPSEQREPLE